MYVKQCLAVAAGGALGTLLRYGINLLLLPTGMPVGTVMENTAGSFLLGLLTGWLLTRSVPSWVKAGAGAGFCGGFTTMSTLASDTILLSAESAAAPLLYVTVSLFGGLCAAAAGMLTGWKLSSREVTS
ncbi:fluoride efflux transporter FluC [Alkalicoccus chagannorensis]|uniref:fluoride efflux transporter FluC n=1 Tax=Alkalicoccus chagannorensis TaxID=427072 RepID=UPI0004286966|nr:CrcB family protein [Alkalicoccus chagannorensis]